MFILAAKL